MGAKGDERLKTVWIVSKRYTGSEALMLVASEEDEKKARRIASSVILKPSTHTVTVRSARVPKKEEAQ